MVGVVHDVKSAMTKAVANAGLTGISDSALATAAQAVFAGTHSADQYNGLCIQPSKAAFGGWYNHFDIASRMNALG